MPKFNVDITMPDTICRNGSTSVDVSTSPSSVGIVSYAWSPSAEAMPSNGQTSVLSPQETTMFYGCNLRLRLCSPRFNPCICYWWGTVGEY